MLNDIITLLLCIGVAALFFAILGGIAELICRGMDDDD